jgi:hypothetical protein
MGIHGGYPALIRNVSSSNIDFGGGYWLLGGGNPHPTTLII